MRPSSKMKTRSHAAPAASRAPARKPESAERAALMKRRATLDTGMGNAHKLLSGKALEKRAAARIKALREQATSMPRKVPGMVMVRALARNEAGLPIPLVGAHVHLSAGEAILAEATVDPGGLALLVLADSSRKEITEDTNASTREVEKAHLEVDGPYEIAVLTPDGRPAARERGTWANEGTAHILEVASSQELEPYLRRGAGFARALAKAEDSAKEIVQTLRASLESQITRAERRIENIDRALARHKPTTNKE